MIGRTMRAPTRAAAAAFVLLLVGLVASARAATLQQDRSWGGPGSDAAQGVAVAADGSRYLAGNTNSFSADGSMAVFVVKFAADGSLAWQRTYESPTAFGSDTATDAAVAADGSVYVTGTTFGVGGDLLLLKFSAVGELLWQRSWGGSAFEGGQDVAVASDGSVYVVGGTTTFGTGNDLTVLKFTPGGTLVWQQTWGPARGDGIAIGPDGNLYLAGTVPRPGGVGGDADIVVLSIDPAGVLRRQRQYSAGDSVDARGGVAVAADGSVAVAGAVTAPGAGGIIDLEAVIVRFSSDGSLEWDRSWGGKSGDTGEAVAIASDGTVLLAGNTNSFGSGSDDAFLLRLRPNGRRIDASLWGGSEIDHANDLAVAAGGTIHLGGSVQTPPWVFQDGPAQVSRLRGTISTPTTQLAPAAGTTADPGGSIATPAGSTTYAGSDDATLLRIGG
jgi:uncharacterized delta-60 repeat protein